MTTAPPFASTGSSSRAIPALSVAVAAVFAGPLVYLVVRVAEQGGPAWRRAINADTFGAVVRTVVLAATVTVLSAAVGTVLAWLCVRTDMPGRRMLRLLCPLPLVMPSFVAALAMLAGVAPGGLLTEALRPFGVDRLPRLDGFLGATAVLTSLSYPYVFLPVAARLKSLPSSLEETARLFGRRPLSILARIVAPQIATAVAAGGSLVALYVVSDFGAVQVVRYDTLTRQIYAARLLDPATSQVQSLVLAALAFALVAGERVTNRRLPRVTVGSSRHTGLMPLGRLRYPGLVVVLAVIAHALIIPLSVLAWWAVRGGVLNDGGVGALGADPGGLLRPTLNSALSGVVAAFAAVLISLPVAWHTVRRRGATAAGVSAIVTAAFAMPGLVVALALVFWLSGTALYGTFAVLVAAYVIHFGGQALRAGQVAVGGLPPRVVEAARMLGASRWRRFVSVELPLMAPGLAAGGGLVLLSTLKELPATLLLAPLGFETLATRIWGASEDLFLAETGGAALLLVALSGVLTWALVLRRMDRLDA